MSKANRADYVTLEYIVQEYMSARGETTNDRYAMYYQLAIRGFKKLNTDVIGSIKVCEKALTASNTIKFPKDFINYVRIGSLSGNDIFWLGRNDGLVINRCGDVLKDNQQSTGTYINDLYPNGSDAYYNGSGFYGIGGGNNVHGYYKIDYEKGEIAFDSVVNGTIIMEYLSDGITDASEIFVHSFCEEAIISYIRWKSISLRDNVSLGEKQYAEMQFKEDMSMALKRYRAMNKEEWLQVLRKRNMAAPRF